MKWHDVADHWTAFVPRILTRWPDLSEDDVLSVDGDRAMLAALIADDRGIRSADADLEVAEWLDGAQPADAMMDESRDDERIHESVRDIPAGEDPSDDDAAFGDDDLVESPVGRD